MPEQDGNSNKKVLLTIIEAAEMASISKSQAYRLVWQNIWPHVRIGTLVRIPKQELLDWIEANTHRPNDRRRRSWLNDAANAENEEWLAG